MVRHQGLARSRCMILKVGESRLRSSHHNK